MECRFCFEETDHLVYQCSCTAGVCEPCLTRWLAENGSRDVCEVCLTPWDKKYGPRPYKYLYEACATSLLVFCVYVCLVSSYVMGNASMSDDILTFYVSLEVLFHVILCAVFCAFPRSYRFRLWAVLRVAFSAWPSIYMVYEYFDIAQYQPQSALMKTVFAQWKTVGCVQGIYVLVMCICYVSSTRTPRRDWEPMHVEVM